MPSSAPDDYDRVPYPSKAEPLAHPDVLRRAALERGLAAAPAERARVLELGCGDAANLVALAFRLPEARFVGLDRSRGAMGRAQNAVTSLELKNLDLRCVDLSRVNVEAGTFDYVVAHGLASWVDPETLDTALSLARRALDARGVLYLSYNVSVAWGLRGALRETLQQAARGVDDPTERIARARKALELLASVLGPPRQGEHHSFVLAREIELLREAPDYAILHDFLSLHNHAYSVREMASRAARHGLAMLSELRIVGVDRRTSAARRAHIARVTGDPMMAELVSDVLDRRAFRATAFVRSDAPFEASARRGVDLDAVELATPLLVRAEPLVYEAPDGSVVRLEDVGLGAAIAELARAWPAGSSLRALEAVDEPALRELLLALIAAGHVHARERPFRCAAVLTERPTASRLARYEAARRPFATNVQHEPIPLDGASRELLRAMDGSRTLAELEALGGRERLDAIRHEGLLEA